MFIMFCSIQVLSDNDLDNFFFTFRKNIGEHYNYLRGCHNNIIRNTNHCETLKIGSKKDFKIMMSYLSYKLKDLKLLLSCVKWNIVSNKL